MSGKNDIHNDPNANTNGFQKNPQNINRKGAPPSIKNELKELMLKDGTLPLPKEYLKSEDNDTYYFRLPTQAMLALKLITVAMGKGKDSFQALKLMLETFDGKSPSTVTVKTDGVLDVTPLTFFKTDDKDK